MKILVFMFEAPVLSLILKKKRKLHPPPDSPRQKNSFYISLNQYKKINLYN